MWFVSVALAVPVVVQAPLDREIISSTRVDGVVHGSTDLLLLQHGGRPGPRGWPLPIVSASAVDGTVHHQFQAPWREEEDYLTTADLDGDGEDEILALVLGEVHAYTLQGDLLAVTPVGRRIDRLRVADVDADGAPEYLVVHPESEGGDAQILELDGTALWQSAFDLGTEVVWVQLDADPQLEVLVVDTVLDGRTFLTERVVPLPPPSSARRYRYEAGDLDGDGFPELLVREAGWSLYDLRTGARRWRSTRRSRDARLLDVDGDGHSEVVLFDTEIFVLDGLTGAELLGAGRTDAAGRGGDGPSPDMGGAPVDGGPGARAAACGRGEGRTGRGHVGAAVAEGYGLGRSRRVSRPLRGTMTRGRPPIGPDMSGEGHPRRCTEEIWPDLYNREAR